MRHESRTCRFEPDCNSDSRFAVRRRRHGPLERVYRMPVQSTKLTASALEAGLYRISSYKIDWNMHSACYCSIRKDIIDEFP